MTQNNLTNFLAETGQTDRPKSGALMALFVGGVGALLYSGYHGISAALLFTTHSAAGVAFQIFGIALLEYTLFCILLAWYRGEIVDSGQKWTSGVVVAAGVLLSILNTQVDSRIHAGVALTQFLQFYMVNVLPSVPFLMLVGGVLTVEMSPAQVLKRRQSVQVTEYARRMFDAEMKTRAAERDADLKAVNVRLNAKLRALEHLEAYYQSDDLQAQLLTEAQRGARDFFRQLGVGVPTGAEPPAPRLQPAQPQRPAIQAAAPADDEAANGRATFRSDAAPDGGK